MELFDVVIVGGGPAGMSAALVLARCRRKVIIFDTGKQRNRWAKEMHGYLTRDGVPPKEYLKIACDELKKYQVQMVKKAVVRGCKNQEENVFELYDEDGKCYCARKLLFASGLKDNLPSIENFENFYGKSIHHCPYCDGWESRDMSIVVYGKGAAAYGLAKNMLQWSHLITICSDGPSRITRDKKEELRLKNIEIIDKKIKRLEGEGHQLQHIIFKDDSRFACDKMFFTTGFEAQSRLPIEMGCSTSKKDEVLVDRLQMSSVEGLYVSGDAAHEMKLVIIAAGEGAKAAVAINIALTEDDERVNNKMQETAQKL